MLYFQLTEREFAPIIGVSQSIVNRMANDYRDITHEEMMSLNKHFKVSLNWLILGIGEPFIERYTDIQRIEQKIDKLLNASQKSK